MDNLCENENSKPVILFGRDIRKIPCFRASMLYGIYGGLATGLVTFMFTSRVKLTTHMAIGSYMGIATVYWCYCRYNYAMQKLAMNKVQQAFRQNLANKQEMNEGFQKQQEAPVDA